MTPKRWHWMTDVDDFKPPCPSPCPPHYVKDSIGRTIKAPWLDVNEYPPSSKEEVTSIREILKKQNVKTKIVRKYRSTRIYGLCEKEDITRLMECFGQYPAGQSTSAEYGVVTVSWGP